MLSSLPCLPPPWQKALGVLLAEDRLPGQSLLCTVRSQKAPVSWEGEEHPDGHRPGRGITLRCGVWQSAGFLHPLLRCVPKGTGFGWALTSAPVLWPWIC